jgi:hypothetical protein
VIAERQGLKIAACSLKTNFMADKKHDQPISQPDPETTHRTDPQEHMEGPVSSLMQNVRETAEEADRPAKKEQHEQEREEEERKAQDRQEGAE